MGKSASSFLNFHRESIGISLISLWLEIVLCSLVLVKIFVTNLDFAIVFVINDFRWVGSLQFESCGVYVSVLIARGLQL